MGISGLLPLLKSIQRPCNLKKFAGQTIGVDAYGWLHRGTVACAIDLALGKPTTKFVDYSIHKVRMLLHFGVVPYLVFDGDYLPSKAATEVERAKKRAESKRMGLELHRMGKISQAHLELQKAVDVTPEMARQLIDALKQEGVQYIVAPYEADAQLAYLEKKGIIQGILSEDSDLLVFGAKRLLTKLEQFGDCIEILRDDFTACREISMVGWTDADFRCMAILSGCDYLPRINKMGLRTAYRKVQKYKTIDRILRMLQFDGQICVPAGYLDAFKRAELTFLHQRVFCPIANEIVMATQPPQGTNAEDLDFLGSHVEQAIALGVVKGDLHPMTKRPLSSNSNSSQPPRTPWSNAHKQTAATLSDLKPNKSIETYFKAYRVPLAELDPNSFTPSPTQQSLLSRNNSTWVSSPAPARHGLPRSSASVLSSATASTARRGGLKSNVGSISASHPKKRRLCSESVEDELVNEANTIYESSHFFQSSTADPSPSAKSTKRAANRKKANFNIWSDDSTEDAMAEIPDLSPMLTLPKSEVVQTSMDGQATVEQSSSLSVAVEDPGTEPQSSTISSSTSRTETSACTSVMSAAEPVESMCSSNTIDTHVHPELATLRKETLCQPEPEKCRLQRQEIIRHSTKAKQRPVMQRSGTMTPLQRLGATALNRSFSYSSSLNRSSQVQEQQRVKDAGRQLPKLADVLKAPIRASTPALATSVTPARVVKGSEDAMVPDSEAESDEAHSESGQGKPTIDLGRFAFTG
ncbi:MAG: hypothetical protein LQ348_000069 [Seirophora lacunosa]|nr:MAG: hypothetical protein LQ348_000069 [Seirophora lacunosa]